MHVNNPLPVNSIIPWIGRMIWALLIPIYVESKNPTRLGWARKRCSAMTWKVGCAGACLRSPGIRAMPYGVVNTCGAYSIVDHPPCLPIVFLPPLYNQLSNEQGKKSRKPFPWCLIYGKYNCSPMWPHYRQTSPLYNRVCTAPRDYWGEKQKYIPVKEIILYNWDNYRWKSWLDNI